jgi:hypothetical protein
MSLLNPPPSADMLHQLQQRLGLRYWTLRHCEACGCSIGFSFPTDGPHWDGGCDCSPSWPEPRTWQDVATEYARAPAPEAWGLAPPPPALPVAKRPTLPQVLAELERELSTRARVYPRWAADPKNALTPEAAAHRQACIDEALQLLRRQLPQQQRLF